mmetsp:Transcript_10147/g.16632  ORF Transcript_10147/g.16632 Transcript_10147/m.16632 type:complete len:416 (-) Transcript_10147:209-1456(-)
MLRAMFDLLSNSNRVRLLLSLSLVSMSVARRAKFVSSSSTFEAFPKCVCMPMVRSSIFLFMFWLQPCRFISTNFEFSHRMEFLCWSNLRLMSVARCSIAVSRLSTLQAVLDWHCMSTIIPSSLFSTCSFNMFRFPSIALERSVTTCSSSFTMLCIRSWVVEFSDRTDCLCWSNLSLMSPARYSIAVSRPSTLQAFSDWHCMPTMMPASCLSTCSFNVFRFNSIVLECSVTTCNSSFTMLCTHSWLGIVLKRVVHSIAFAHALNASSFTSCTTSDSAMNFAVFGTVSASTLSWSFAVNASSCSMLAAFPAHALVSTTAASSSNAICVGEVSTKILISRTRSDNSKNSQEDGNLLVNALSSSCEAADLVTIFNSSTASAKAKKYWLDGTAFRSSLVCTSAFRSSSCVALVSTNDARA